MSGSRKKLETRQELAQRELALAKKLSPEEKTRVREKMRREVSFMDQMSGLAAAARQLAREEQLLLNFDPKGRPVN